MTVESNPDQEVTPENTTPDPLTEVLSQITNPSGEQKYKDALTALNSIKPKDEHIASLEQQIAETKLQLLETTQELDSRQSTEELVNKVMENQESKPAVKPTDEAEEKIDIGELVRKELAGISEETSKVSNREKVASALAEQYGDKATEVLTVKMQELNVTPEFFKSVIEQSPASALELLGVSKPKGPQAPVKPQSSVRTEQFSETASTQQTSVMSKDTKDVVSLWDNLMEEAKAS